VSLSSLIAYVSARSRREPSQHGAVGPCWIWEKATALRPGAKRRPVARIASIANGKTFCVRSELLCEQNNWRIKPKEIVAVMTCGRELCVNPDHIKPGRLAVTTQVVAS